MRNLNFMLWVFIIPLFLIQGCLTSIAPNGATKTKQENIEVQKTPVQSPDKKGRYVEGELIVRFNDSVTKQEMEKIISLIGARTIRTVSKERKTFLILLPEELSLKDAIDELSKRPDILYAEPNRIYQLEGE